MKIRLKHYTGYDSLRAVQFPVELEARLSVYGRSAYVKFSVIEQLPGYVRCALDVREGEDYIFLRGEYEVVEDEPSLSDLFGDNISDSAKADLKQAGDLAAKELEEKMSGADRKAALLGLIDDYRVAINNGCCESAFGDTDRMKIWEDEEKSLLAQITKMINDGV